MVLNWKLNFSLRFLSRTLSLMAVWAHSEESWLCWEWTRIVLKFTDEFVKFFHRQCFWLKFAWNSCKIHHNTWEADWKVHHETWADCKFTSTHGKKSWWVTSAHHKKSFVKEDLIKWDQNFAFKAAAISPLFTMQEGELANASPPFKLL